MVLLPERNKFFLIKSGTLEYLENSYSDSTQSISFIQAMGFERGAQGFRLLKSISLTTFYTDALNYTTLSHTWGSDEISFQDLVNGRDPDKAGNEKLLFCDNVARKNGLEYF
ncbi:uncharacterized protein EAF01_010672 [Botrytis porri]|uniref:Uncharacterized protein n=1 Tax=Botrytis porri TaxID=87229 RepID=A0A4Z1KEL4_9HELO|nr:uncharacterized protein EAF01_010672 [Botrytis porri]KAF7890863.1 hypothetical protein EAF01_010672 [Botrytis porri]TGO84481.1 hypothetical protein BPOR_0500g00070 [Botrytis porri]